MWDRFMHITILKGRQGIQWLCSPENISVFNLWGFHMTFLCFVLWTNLAISHCSARLQCMLTHRGTLRVKWALLKFDAQMGFLAFSADFLSCCSCFTEFLSYLRGCISKLLCNLGMAAQWWHVSLEQTVPSLKFVCSPHAYVGSSKKHAF